MRVERAARATGSALLMLMLLAPAACERFDETPREVAAAFWSALTVRDLAAARAVSDAASDADLRELVGGLALENVALEAILRNESTALVETSAFLPRGEMDLEFNTHLTRDGEGWRVDVAATERELRRTALAVSFEEVRESITESTDLLVEEFEKRALEASESLRETLQELEHSLREETTPPPFEDLPEDGPLPPTGSAEPNGATGPAL